MTNLDRQLQQLQNDNLQEIDPLTGSAILGTGYLISVLTFFLYTAGDISRALKPDKKLSNRINLILGTKNYWIVHKYPEKTPNAFALGMGRHIFITTGLLDFLIPREVEAVLLHEIHHNKNKDAYKSLAYKHSFFYLITFIALSISSFPLGILAFLLMIKANNILHARLLGRSQEIKADKFSVKYGYGKELISAFQKIDKIIQKIHSSKPCGKWCQFERKVSDIIDEHPSTKKRTEIILRSADKIKKMTFTRMKDYIMRIFKENG